MSKRYAVFGHPVLHSLSPKIHQAFGRQAGIDLEYVAIECAPGDLPGTLASFAKSGGLGANVTLPHKQRAAELCNLLSKRAQRAGAVNTLIRHDTGWLGDNTDGAGLVRDLTERHGLDLRGRRTGQAMRWSPDSKPRSRRSATPWRGRSRVRGAGHARELDSRRKARSATAASRSA